MSSTAEKRHLSQLSDDEVRALYKKHNQNATEASREVGCGPSTFRQRMALLNDPNYVADKEKSAALAFLMEELEARGIDPRGVNIKRAVVQTDKKRWQTMHKDQGGNAVVTPLAGDRRHVAIQFSPKFEEGPKWPLIRPGKPCKITYKRSFRKKQEGVRKVFTWPDTQIGWYRDVRTMKLTPMHDYAAIEVALQALDLFEPDEVVVLGDFLDLSQMSKYRQLPEFSLTTQPAIDYGYKLLARIRSIVGQECKIVYINGNHEVRLNSWIIDSAKAAYGLRPGYATPTDWPLFSIPTLLGFDAEHNNIETVGEYPSGEYWASTDPRNPWVLVHADPTSARDIRANVTHGHRPRNRYEVKTVHSHDGTHEYIVCAGGGLMGIGEVNDPNLLSRTKTTSALTRENWQNGFVTGLVFDNGFLDLRVHRIQFGMCSFDGHLLDGREQAEVEQKQFAEEQADMLLGRV